MSNHGDLLIIGAGPAGLSAACAARACGLDVVVVDDQPAPGGQLLRNIETPMAKALLDNSEYVAGMQLLEDFYKSGARYFPETTVWGCEPRSILCSIGDKATTITTARLATASGAMERPVPFPGWTLPGVMGAGGADILLRSGGSLPVTHDAPVILAGNGPLLLLLAQHLLEAGVPVAAWLDTGNWPKRLLGAGMLPAGILDRAYLAKGLGLGMGVLKSKIKILSGVTNIQAIGTDRLEAVRWQAGGKTHELPAGLLLRHEGVIPRTHILTSMKARHYWDNVQRCWCPVTGENGETSLAGVYMAGDGAFAHGGDAARLKGTLTGIAVAHSLGVLSREEAVCRSAPIRKKLRTMCAARAFLRYVFAPNPAIYSLPDETLVCRCECVTAGAIRKAVADGYHEVNAIKRVTRCGMGSCQGRMCGPGLAEIAAAAQGRSPADVGVLNIRQPLRPVVLQKYCEAALPG